MEWVKKRTGLLVKSWCKDPESGAMEQAWNLADLPFAFRHIALMPDVHQGYGMPIGGVMATQGAIIPNCVGVDIGCGIRAVKTNFPCKDLNTDTIKSIMGKTREVIPVGFNHHENEQAWEGFDSAPDIRIIQQELSAATKQLGTLGGGNHFIELQESTEGNLWLMIHSGSRNFGYKIAREYHNKAKELCERWYSCIPTPDLAFLPIGTHEAKEYYEAMNYALAFAKENRRVMMARLINVVKELIAMETILGIDIHHNYARFENHFKKNLIVHRKGATSAREGEEGIIPGSQGTCSYIVEGLGNPESFTSCSHGAGRTMSRKKARDTLDLEETIKELNAKGVVHSIRNVADLDEAPGAYKEIDGVMEAQKDLVKIVTKLTPLGVIKG